jgi:mannose/fructose/N-acetylgalactosamine-specific phosphotransferase system component IIB
MEKLNKEQREFVRKVLSNPSSEIVNIALGYVNLTEFQKQILKILELDKKTEMEAVDILSTDEYYVDLRKIQRAKKEAFEKMYEVWSNNYLISKIVQ